MYDQGNESTGPDEPCRTDGITEVRRQEALLKTGALQDAIFNSANFSSIATDDKGVIQIFNVGAERMLGYTAVEVMNKITPADISDPQEVIARARALSGVRSSWLMLERKSDLARLAFFATAMALCSSSSTCFRTELSVPIRR